MDFKQLQARLGRNGQAIVAGGVLVLIDSFFAWYGLSGKESSELKAMGYKTSVTAWGAGFGAWFSVLLLIAVAAVTVLAAMGILKLAPLMVGFVQAAGSVLAVVVVLLRWMTYQSASGGGSSVGALFGTYIGVVLAIVIAVFAYLDFVAKGGDIKNLPAVFQGGGQGGAPFTAQPPAQPYYQGGPAQPYNQPPAGQGYDPNQGQQQYNPNQGQQQYDPNQGGGQPYQGGPYNQG